MKKIIIGFAMLLFISFQSMAQLSAVDYAGEEFTQFKGSKTYIVQTGNAKFDDELSSAMKDLWTITPFESIDDKTFKTKLIDKSASFILSIIIYTGTSNQNYHFLALINGGKKNLGKYAYDDMLAYCPINHWGNENNNVECAYRLRNMLQSMVQSMDIVQKQNIHGNSLSIVNGLKKVYLSRAGVIKDRTLLFCDESLKPNAGPGRTFGSPSNKEIAEHYQPIIAGIYPYKFEICSKEKLEQVIKDKSTDYYYFQPAITLNKCKFVFDPATGEVVYFDFNVQGMKIKDGDIEDLAKAVKAGKK